MRWSSRTRPLSTDEPALFHLINLAREEGAFLLFTARSAPTLWPASLPDLVSRLRALPAVTLDAPDDGLLRGVLVKVAADRQLSLDDSVVRYLLTRIERSPCRGASRGHRARQGGAAAGPRTEPRTGRGNVSRRAC